MRWVCNHDIPKKSWDDTLTWFIKKAKEMRANRETKNANLAVAEFVGETKANLAVAKTRSSAWALTEKKFETELGTFTAVRIGKKSKYTQSSKDVIAEMDKSLLSDADRARASYDQYFFDHDDEVAQHIRWSRCAYVTRNMTKAERISERGRNALSEELRKVIDKGTFGTPDDVVNDKVAAARTPKATSSGLCMLASVKHAEKPTDQQKLKGRIVVLGNRIYILGSGRETFPKGKDFGLFGDVASLAAFRSVAYHSTKEGYVLESADVANAYLNASWPDDQEPHFLRVDRQIYELLPDEWKTAVDANGGPGRALLSMQKCLYGHPLSGFLWIQQLHTWLKNNRYEPVEGTKALYRRGNVLVCAYVDDLAVAGPRDEVDQLWAALCKTRGGEYDLREVGDCTEFLGVQVGRTKVEHGWRVELSMEDYCKSIVKSFEELFYDQIDRINARDRD